MRNLTHTLTENYNGCKASVLESTSLCAQYNNLINSKNQLTYDIGTILDNFISKETPLLKKRILSVYERVSPSKLAELYTILSQITYGPIKVPNVSLTDNEINYNGSLIYYRYTSSSYDVQSILAFMYKGTDGKNAVKYYRTNNSLQNTIDVHFQNIECDSVPHNWHRNMSAISGSDAGPLIEFLKRDFDLGELGDKHCAIPDYYDVEMKLHTDREYFWQMRHQQSEERRAHLQDELRSSIEMYENRTGIDVQQHEWELVQSLLQKALVELQIMP